MSEPKTEPDYSKDGRMPILTEFCAVERAASMGCLEDTGYDHAKCEQFFSAYRDCKRRWVCVSLGLLDGQCPLT